MRLPVRLLKISIAVIGMVTILVAVASAIIVWQAGPGSTASSVADVPVPKDNGQIQSLSDNKQPAANQSLLTGKTGDSTATHTILDFVIPSSAPVLRNIGNYYDNVLGCYRFHPGIDREMAEGSVVRSVAAGKVIEAGDDPLLGAKVVLDSGDGWTVVYGGLSNLRVQSGDEVEKHEVIGQIAGCAESDQGQALLHFEVWHNNEVQIPPIRGEAINIH